MCGIAGIYNTSGEPVSPQVLARMTRLLEHRGPDDEGYWIDGAVGLGHRRLSIIDLETGHQPLSNEDGSLWIVYNGEVYNYLELRPSLAARGHRFRTASDTEVIVHLYEEKGPGCLEELRGMFAFALWNAKDRTLFLARDRIGIKPLFYALLPHTILFASEIKSLLAHPDLAAEIDYPSLLDYLSFRYVPAPRTLFKNIYKLKPGHSLSVRNGTVVESRYWDVFDDHGRPDERLCGFDAAKERLRTLVEEAVRLRLRSDVPLGAFLSGGIDSSTLVGIMSTLVDAPIQTFSVGFEDPRFDELPFARAVAKHFHTIHREVVVRPEDIPRHLPTLIRHRDAPVSESSDVALYLVSQLARESVKVVLSGEGGDELFAGYAKYLIEPIVPYFQRIPEWLARGLVSRPVDRLPASYRALKSAVRSMGLRDETQRFVSYFASVDLAERSQILSDEFLEALGRERHPDVFAHYMAQVRGRSPLERMFYGDMKLWLPDNLLERGDRITMAASLEGRVPLLDHKLVEFAARLPFSWKKGVLEGKRILKEAFRDMLPRAILHRKKVGFTVPVRTWFREELWEWLRGTLLSEDARGRGIFRSAQVEDVLARHASGKGDFSKQLWMLLNLELWFGQLGEYRHLTRSEGETAWRQ